ncbi:Glyco_trans_2-like domain-containing protein [Mucor velutinosus]|uniref:Glyco_trans_2-like domain-containing protein n=1 Tax=Mucor velutinosus TaxID=708070 RepID=A0AAN7D663_9FUNG|nr:Glyco_trans_2-like domain-containing protein [Mucor velutinosus]
MKAALLNYPFELVAPMTAIGSVLLLPLGPLLIPRTYIVFLLVYFTIFLYTQVNHVFKFYTTATKMTKAIREWNQRSNKNNATEKIDSTTASPPSPTTTRERIISVEELVEMETSLNPYDDSHFIHAFIVPNYAEPEALLRDTIKRLANHKNAQTNYVIILAMEASELNYEQKSNSLADYFKDSFLQFIVTAHPADIPGETRGKGSNVAYAARHGCAQMLQHGIDRRRVILTVSDSDSSIPELYTKEVEKAFNRAEDPYFLLFAPPIFFSRNCYEVPAAVRMTDITWSAMVMSSLSNSRGLSFPCSTYSLSMVLAERVGYWDTDADSVGEDMHMMLKCFFKTDGLARCCPIFVPINLTNVQTPGYLANMNARFVQAKRHYNGIADLAYTLRNSFGVKDTVIDGNHVFASLTAKKTSMYAAPSFWLDKLVMCTKVMEAHLIPVTSGWLMFAAVPLMQFILFPPHSMVAFVEPTENPILTSEFYATLWNIVKIITVFLPLPLFGTLAIYEHLHRVVDRELYGKSETRTWRNVFDYISLPIAAWAFMTLPATIACIKRLYKTNDKYIVAEKFFDEDNEQ